MHSPDDKHYPLAQPKRPSPSRRSVSKKDFKLPKPYRRQVYSEEPDRLTRMQVSLIGFAGLMVATLIGVLALMAHEDELSPEGKVIVAAARLEPVDTDEAQYASFQARPVKDESGTPPALRHGARTAAQASAAAETVVKSKAKAIAKARAEAAVSLADPRKKASPSTSAPAILAARVRKAKAVPVQAAAPEPSDPDVALITAILLLTPAPSPAAVPGTVSDLAARAQVCAATAFKGEHCTELHKIKH